MNDVSGTIKANDKEYKLVFNLNVMERIQEEFKSLDEWGKLTDGSKGEPNIKALIFGLTEMMNEAIDIDNEKNNTNVKPLTKKQVGRIVTEFGLSEVAAVMNDTVIRSAGNDEKNA